MLSSYSRLVWLLVVASVARVSKSCPNSPSLNFTMSTTVDDPSWLRWITVGLCSLWFSFFFLSFLFLLFLCWSACCFSYGFASGWFLGGWFPSWWSSLGWTSLFGGIFVWASWVGLATRCVSGGVETGGSRFGKYSWFGGGDGDGEWSGVSGVVGIFPVNRESTTSVGESTGSSRLSEKRLSTSWLIANVSSW